MDERSEYYARVRVRRKRTSDVEPERSWLRLNPALLTGRLSADLVTLQPLHAGSGALVPPEALGLEVPNPPPLVKAFARRDGQRIIPGSALKGAFRSLVELFTPSCVCKTKERKIRRDPRYQECRYTLERRQRELYPAPHTASTATTGEDNPERRQGELCPACKMFGGMGYRGQVRFDDAPQQAGGISILHRIPPQYPPRPDPDHRRYYPHALVDPRERTWPLEVVPPGQRFALTAQFTNLSEGELGLLLIALGQGEWALCPKIGAGKSSGLGAVRIEALVVERWRPEKAYRAFDDTAAWEPVDVQRCIEQAGKQGLYFPEVLERLARDLAETAVPEVQDG